MLGIVPGIRFERSTEIVLSDLLQGCSFAITLEPIDFRRAVEAAQRLLRDRQVPYAIRFDANENSWSAVISE